MKPLSIAFFGSSLVSAYWNGAATYYRGIVRALHQRGHRITFFEPDAYDRQRHRDIADPPWAEVVVYAPNERAALQMVERASECDVLVKASGVGVLDQFLEDAVPKHVRGDALAIFWDVDAPATLARMTSDPADPFRSRVNLYDFVFTYGGGEPVIEAYRALGARRCAPIYNALDPETHHPAAPIRRFVADLALVANRLPDREARIDEFFFRAARTLPSRTFLLGGNGWGDKHMPPNVNYVGHVYTADHNALNASALAVLNVCRDSMAENGYSPATRVFEAAGASACIITDSWKGIELFLEPEREVLVAKNGREVAELVASLEPSRAKAIGESARRRVLADHTYAQRGAEVERLIQEAMETKRAR